MILRQTLLPACLLLLATACKNSDTPIPSPPPQPQTVECTNATLIYYGDADGIQISNLHRLTLFTDMSVNEQGYPIGPGTMIRLSLNSSPSTSQPIDITLPVGIYRAAQSAQDFNPFTFNYGYNVQLDLPDGKVEMPDGSFYGEIPAGQTVFPADLLTEGQATVAKNEDGTYTVTGVVVGDKCMKRYFTYTGKLDVVDRSSGSEKVENTTLKSDLALSDLSKARIEDRGDFYALNDQSYRSFNLYLAASTIDLQDMWAAGSGNFLQIEFFVPYATKVSNGIPAGQYNVVARTVGGGLSRESIFPFNIASGFPDKFTHPEGAWYFKYENGKAKEFARIDGGVMIVTRSGDAHTIVIEFMDCAQKPNKITVTYNQTSPIDVYQFKPSESINSNNAIKINRR